MPRTTPSLEQPGLIGPRLWTQAATALHRSKATHAATVDAAGPGRLNMSHTRNTEPWVRDPWFKSQASSCKLDRSSGLGYSRINGEVQHLSRFVGPSHITNRRHAHLVRSSMRAARSTLGSARQPTVVVACADPGDRDLKNQASSAKLREP